MRRKHREPAVACQPPENRRRMTFAADSSIIRPPRGGTELSWPCAGLEEAAGYARNRHTETRPGGHHRRGHCRLQRGVPPDETRLARHRRGRARPAVRDRRLDLARAGSRLPDQPVEDHDGVCDVHGAAMVGDGTRRRAVRQDGGEPGGGLDAGAAYRPEAQGRVRLELGCGSSPAQPRRGARPVPHVVRPHPGRVVRALRYSNQGDPPGGSDGA